MTDVVGNPEEERRAEFYYQPWAQEAVCRYFYSKVILDLFHLLFCILFFFDDATDYPNYFTPFKLQIKEQ